MGRLQDKVAVVTGAERRIGLACAERFRARLSLSPANLRP